ncbi:DUF2147 domain-containing protein [Sediminibacterium ginsengisoli]|uniref:DUF2147 domain-containing protein n=1 Tax=Sediminibacterium ginsengisoli TaxID=413434 RepID=A0A1T4L2B6_9BACT|nr:DUF2147 domain-containing protein [Sediminibacterium ginsengisoli]SJZ48882.1 hypothetical protein SAMN04488132_102264 [Sediminibacterium ginsengisoli]
MKKLVFFACILCLCTSFRYKADDSIVGTWINSKGQVHLQIYKQDNKYYGKIIWLQSPNQPNGMPKVDKNNPDHSLRTQPIIGLVILRDFTYRDEEWTSGRIYDPESGKVYRGIMKMPDDATLNMRGYIGISLLGRTETWKRVTK